MAAPQNDEEKIVSLTDVQHARERPGMYIGSVTCDDQVGWFAEEVADGVAHVLRYSQVRLIPGLCKTVDELMVNAGDRSMYDSTQIVFEFTQLEDRLYQFRIYNNGNGIPITPIDDKPGSPLGPTACFGLTRTGTNFGDHAMTVGGTNGFGGTLANIMSEQFNVVTHDLRRRLRFEQTWRDGISSETSDPEPVVTPLVSGQATGTQVTMIPDYAYYMLKNNGEDLTETLQGCMKYLIRRALEIGAFCGDRKTTVQIRHRYIESEEEAEERAAEEASRGQEPETLVGLAEPQVVTITDRMAEYRTFSSYVDGCVSGQASSTGHQAGHYNIEELSNTARWRVYMVYPNADGVAAKAPPIPGMALVNGISCLAGKHVQHVKDVIDRHMRSVGFLGEARAVTTNFRKNATLFIACRIEEIAFDSQTKDKLTTPEKKWCSQAGQTGLFEFSDAQARALLTGGLEEAIGALMGARPARGNGKRPVIPKLEDANNAGKAGCVCTLIITEGDSAKTLVMSGRKELEGGSDFWGIYPIRGKMINSRKKSSDSIARVRKETERREAKEKETKRTLDALLDVIGLRRRMVYQDASTLRYQKLVFMTDQDTDGDHIKGLLINLIEYHWPSLAALPGFIFSIETPLLKAIRETGKSAKKEVLEFTSLAEYEDWQDRVGEKECSKYRIQYYKGLGSSTDTDGRAYFRTLNEYLQGKAPNRNFVEYEFDPESHDNLELVFGSDTERRKAWILRDPGDDYRFQTRQTVTAFLDQRLRAYSKSSNRRAIANIMDGEKPSQRKVLYTALHNNMTNETGVIPFAGLVMGLTGYHHGEASLYGAVVGMARKYVGSNNINFLYPGGQFGSRATHKPAAPRYLKTRLSQITRLIFRPETDPILEHEIDDGRPVEPRWLMPVIPTVLLNGCNGTGTGWRTFVPPHNPTDLTDRLRAMIETEDNDAYESRTVEDRRTMVTRVLKEDAVTGFPRLVPYYKGFRGTIRQSSAFKYEVFGCLGDKPRCHDVRGAGDRQWCVTEFDPSMTIEQYDKFITAVTDSEGKPIFADIHKHNSDTEINFIMFPRKDFQMPEDPMERLQLFGLVTSIDVSNMYLFVPDPAAADGIGFRKYDTTEDILVDFYLIRLEAYERQRLYQIEQLHQKIRKLSAKIRFVLAVIRGAQPETRDQPDALVLANRRHADARADAVRIVGEDYDDLIDDFMKMALRSITQERVEAIRQELAKLEEELVELESINGAALWLDDLDALDAALAQPEEI